MQYTGRALRTHPGKPQPCSTPHLDRRFQAALALSIRTPRHPCASMSFTSLAAASFCSMGKSSLPSRSSRAFLNNRFQNGIAGRAVPVA